MRTNPPVRIQRYGLQRIPDKMKEIQIVACDGFAKLGERPYRILDACHPALASRTLAVEPMIDLLLPCKVAARQDESRLARIEFMGPGAVLEPEGSPGIDVLAAEARQRIVR